MLTIYTDGACLGNPGPMGIGVVIYRKEELVESIGEYVGRGTNNVAEYTAVIRALETALSMGEKEILIRSDSQLLVKQLKGEYKVRDEKLKALKARTEELCAGMKVRFEHIPREKNTEADKLSKQAAEKSQVVGSAP